MAIKKADIKKRFEAHVEKHIDGAIADEARYHAHKIVREAIEPPQEKKERLARERRWKEQDGVVAPSSSKIAVAPPAAAKPGMEHMTPAHRALMRDHGSK